MLTGEKLGQAIETALEQNGKTKAEAARFFGVQPPSVSGWIKTGRISKDNFDRLRAWLVKTPAEHWGAISEPLAPAESSANRTSGNQRLDGVTVAEAVELLSLFAKVPADKRDIILGFVRSAAIGPATTANDKTKRR